MGRLRSSVLLWQLTLELLIDLQDGCSRLGAGQGPVGVGSPIRLLRGLARRRLTTRHRRARKTGLVQSFRLGDDMGEAPGHVFKAAVTHSTGDGIGVMILEAEPEAWAFLRAQLDAAGDEAMASDSVS